MVLWFGVLCLVVLLWFSCCGRVVVYGGILVVIARCLCLCDVLVSWLIVFIGVACCCVVNCVVLLCFRVCLLWSCSCCGHLWCGCCCLWCYCGFLWIYGVSMRLVVVIIVVVVSCCGSISLVILL